MRKVNVKFHIRTYTSANKKNKNKSVIKQIPVEDESGNTLAPIDFRVLVNEARKNILKDFVDEISIKQETKVTPDMISNVHCFHIVYRVGASVFVYTEERELLDLIEDMKVQTIKLQGEE